VIFYDFGADKSFQEIYDAVKPFIKVFKHTRTDWRIGVPNILFTFRDRRKGVLSAEKAGVKL